MKRRALICKKDDGGWYWVRSDEPGEISAGELARSWKGEHIPILDRSERPYKTEAACRAAVKDALGEDVVIETAIYQGAALSTVEENSRPPKPPWQRFMNMNLGLAKLLKLKEIALSLTPNVAWEIGKLLLGRKQQPAQS